MARWVEEYPEGNQITAAPVEMNAGTARIMRDTLIKEIQQKAAEVLDDMSKGMLNDTQLQLQLQAKQAQELVDRINLYSSIFNEGLEGFKSVAQLANGAAAVMQDFAVAGIGICA